MSELFFSGLDGKNPVAFLAALGVLNAVADAQAADDQPTLQWRMVGTHRPVLAASLDRSTLLDVLVRDLESFSDEPALALRYQKNGDGPEAHDLKPPPADFVRYLQNLVERGSTRSLGLAAAFATDVAVDNNGNAKPTALHFTAGQQEFLRMVDDLRAGVTREDFEEALFGPWRYVRPLPVLQWDNSQARDYALRASDPSGGKKLGVPGADWLAFRGLPFFRVAPIRDARSATGCAIATTGCRGGWKSGTFRWPIWTEAIDRRVLASLVACPELFDMDPKVLRGRNIAVVFEASIGRTDQGGYGSFSPARVARAAST